MEDVEGVEHVLGLTMVDMEGMEDTYRPSMEGILGPTVEDVEGMEQVFLLRGWPSGALHYFTKPAGHRPEPDDPQGRHPRQSDNPNVAQGRRPPSP